MSGGNGYMYNNNYMMNMIPPPNAPQPMISNFMPMPPPPPPANTARKWSIYPLINQTIIISSAVDSTVIYCTSLCISAADPSIDGSPQTACLPSSHSSWPLSTRNTTLGLSACPHDKSIIRLLSAMDCHTAYHQTLCSWTATLPADDPPSPAISGNFSVV